MDPLEGELAQKLADSSFGESKVSKRTIQWTFTLSSFVESFIELEDPD